MWQELAVFFSVFVVISITLLGVRELVKWIDREQRFDEDNRNKWWDD